MTDNIDDDTLIDKADALMRRRGFNANLKPAETTDMLTETRALSDDEESMTPSAIEPTIEPATETALQSQTASPVSAVEADGETGTLSPHAPEVLSTEGDIPTLTDVVQTLTQAADHHAAETEPSTRPPVPEPECRKHLETWLEETLPQVVAAALEPLKERITHDLRDRIRTELLPAVASIRTKTDTPPS